jgi:soluble lytic murein transglycosylase
VGLIAAAVSLRTTRSVESYDDVIARVDRFARAARAASASEGVEHELIRAVAAAESAGDPEARSHAGAVGLMQLEPGTASDMAARLSEPRPDLYDPATSMRLGARYLRLQLDRFSEHACAKELALAAYNAGPERVASWLGDGPPPAGEAVLEWPRYAETRQFLARVLDYEARFRARDAAGPAR